MRLWRRIKCIFTGHTYPFLDCFRCGARSPYQFVRDKDGELIRDKKGNPQWEWIGWGW